MQLRLLKTELAAEEIIEDRTVTFFNDRCHVADVTIDYRAYLN